MAKLRIRYPSLRRVTEASTYLRDNDGIEIVPCCWVHLVYPEVMIVTPQGQLLREFSRRRAIALRDQHWDGYWKPAVLFKQQDWPQLTMRWPDRPSVSGDLSLICQNRSLLRPQ